MGAALVVGQAWRASQHAITLTVTISSFGRRRRARSSKVVSIPESLGSSVQEAVMLVSMPSRVALLTIRVSFPTTGVLAQRRRCHRTLDMQSRTERVFGTEGERR